MDTPETNTTEAPNETPAILRGDVITGTVEGDGGRDVRFETGTGRLEDDEKSLTAGESHSFLVEAFDGDVAVLSKTKADHLALWDWVDAHAKNGEPVEARVLSERVDEYAVEIRGLRAILAKKDVAKDRTEPLKIGEVLSLKVLQYRDRKNQLIVSEKALNEPVIVQRREELLEELEVGLELDARVLRFAQFGAFVDLGGVDALLHNKDISWRRVNHPGDELSVGDVVRVKVLDYDVENEKVGVSMKALLPDPWLTAVDVYLDRSQQRGRVTSLTKFGAFIMLDDGIEGLVHLSEMSWTEKVNAPGDFLKLGQTVDCWVIHCDIEKRRLALTMKNPEENPWLSLRDKFAVGEEGEFTVSGVTDFGIFVTLEAPLEGLIHISDFSWAPVDQKPADIYEIGATVRAIMLEIDEERGRANLGIKQLNADLATELMQKYEVGQSVEMTITSIQADGFYGTIEDGLEGFVPVASICDEYQSNFQESLEANQRVNAQVTVCQPVNKSFELAMLGLTVETAPSAETDAGEPEAAEAVTETESTAAAPEEAAAESAEADAIEAAETETESAEAVSVEATAEPANADAVEAAEATTETESAEAVPVEAAAEPAEAAAEVDKEVQVKAVAEDATAESDDAKKAEEAETTEPA